jgi:hypothetical protein
MKKIITLLFLTTILISCLPVNTSNPENAFGYWSGMKPPEGMEIFEGKYNRSPHFTMEYEFILKFKPTEKWWKEYISINELKIDTIKNNWSKNIKLPKWFNTNENYTIYSKNDELDHSRYFINPSTGICYIYETVGM